MARVSVARDRRPGETQIARQGRPQHLRRLEGVERMVGADRHFERYRRSTADIGGERILMHGLLAAIRQHHGIVENAGSLATGLVIERDLGTDDLGLAFQAGADHRRAGLRDLGPAVEQIDTFRLGDIRARARDAPKHIPRRTAHPLLPKRGQPDKQYEYHPVNLTPAGLPS